MYLTYMTLCVCHVAQLLQWEVLWAGVRLKTVVTEFRDKFNSDVLSERCTIIILLPCMVIQYRIELQYFM